MRVGCPLQLVVRRGLSWIGDDVNSGEFGLQKKALRLLLPYSTIRWVSSFLLRVCYSSLPGLVCLEFGCNDSGNDPDSDAAFCFVASEFSNALKN